ncbi:MAG TPA: VOC family protein [Limnochordia bacterium]|nr:VOC family protein [Limnochordia bacterium]
MGYHSTSATYVRTVALRVENLERSLRFYHDILGFQILDQDKTGAKLTADGKTVVLSLVQPEGVTPKEGKRAGLYHFALLLPERSNLASMVNNLARQGVRFGSADHLVSEAIYFEDPDGNGIEVYSDTDSATWVWSEEGVKMDSKPLDFDDLLQEDAAQGPTFVLPKKTIIGHIHLHVSNLQEAEKFYTEGLGFEIATRFRDSALFLSTSKYHHHIALNTWNGVGAPPTPEHSVGLDVYTLLFPDEEARQAAISSLERLGAALHSKDGRITVADPAGNNIELAVQEE